MGTAEETALWTNIKALSMEYHLWGRPGIELENLFQLLDSINFKIIKHSVLSDQQGIVLAINNEF